MADPQFDWWRAARNNTFGPIQEANPQSGYYRHYAGPAVAIFRGADGALWVLLDDTPIEDPIQRGKIWLQVAKNPVTKAEYDARLKTGE